MSEKIEDRKDSEEGREDGAMPAWADSLGKGLKSLHDRLDALEKERKDSRDEGEDPIENTDGKKRADEAAEVADRKDSEKEEAKEIEAKAAKEREDKSRKDGEEREEKERADRARHDASIVKANREMEAQIREMNARLNNVYAEPSYEDRNAIASARSRADSLYQGLSGQPASQPLPGESPISYRKRLVDGLRKFSATFKDTRVDSLTGEVFDHIESQIYADAAAALKSPEVMPAGQLRAVTRNDMGHIVTEYIGDAKAAWAPFSAGAAFTVKLNKPAAH